jgi:cardiolipin synthase
MTPYFLPGPDIVAALLGARLRGVDVRIILPSKNNIFLVHWANQNILSYFLEKDIAIYFQPPPFAHTKAIIIDDNYSLIGSANLDARSLRLNFELGVEIFDAGLNGRLADYLQTRAAAARRVEAEQLQSISFPVRIRNALAWLFSPYL